MFVFTPPPAPLRYITTAIFLPPPLQVLVCFVSGGEGGTIALQQFAMLGWLSLQGSWNMWGVKVGLTCQGGYQRLTMAQGDPPLVVNLFQATQALLF